MNSFRGRVAERVAARLGADPRDRRLQIAEKRQDRTPARLRVVTTMATWCDTCKGELPQVALLRKTFSPEEVDLLAVPVDADDDAERLSRYKAEHAPAYELLDDLSKAQIAAVKKVVIDDLRVDALPAAIITDGNGRILRTLWYVPSISEIRELLDEAKT